jgi:hypothetical protein
MAFENFIFGGILFSFMTANCPNCCDESYKCSQTVESTRFHMISESLCLRPLCIFIYFFFLFFLSQKSGRLSLRKQENPKISTAEGDLCILMRTEKFVRTSFI